MPSGKCGAPDTEPRPSGMGRWAGDELITVSSRPVRSPTARSSRSFVGRRRVIRPATRCRGTGAAAGSAPWLGDPGCAQRAERRPELGGEQLGLLPGGEVPAAGGLGEVAEGGVGLLGP